MLFPIFNWFNWHWFKFTARLEPFLCLRGVPPAPTASSHNPKTCMLGSALAVDGCLCLLACERLVTCQGVSHLSLHDNWNRPQPLWSYELDMWKKGDQMLCKCNYTVFMPLLLYVPSSFIHISLLMLFLPSMFYLCFVNPPAWTGKHFGSKPVVFKCAIKIQVTQQLRANEHIPNL